MSITFAEISRLHQVFIQHTLATFETQLHPSTTEDAELVTRAMFSVRNQAVRLHNYSTFTNILTCRIQDARVVEVIINFPRKNISCSCPQEGICRHKLAVIFKLSQYLISLQDWASKWRSKKTIPLKALAAERSPESWQRMVDEVLNHAFPSNRAIEMFILPSLMDNARLKLLRQRPFEREWQPLFDLFIEVTMLKRLYEQAISTNMEIKGNHFGHYLENTFDRMWDSIDEIINKPRLFATEPFIDALQESVRAITLMKHGAPHHRLVFYFDFWTLFFTEKKRMTKELNTLEAISTLQSDIDLMSIKLFLYMLLDETEAIEQAITQMTTVNIEAFIEIAKLALVKNKPRIAELILKQALPLLENYIQNDLSPVRRLKFTRTLNKLYADITLTEDEELLLYASFGRYGTDSFSDYLLRNARYSEWIALHQLFPSSISYLDQCGLKEVLAHAPEAALPLYHFYAMNEIQQKSRYNYKQAVRIWRAMKSAAKKAGKLDYFASYIETIQQQYKRLRALQEEISKSNLTV